MGRIRVDHSVAVTEGNPHGMTEGNPHGTPPLEYINYTAVIAPNRDQPGFVAGRRTCAELP
jgi:hypothetical protein